MNGSWDAYLASPADFAGADDITNLVKGERAWDLDHRTHSLIFDYYTSMATILNSAPIPSDLLQTKFFSMISCLISIPYNLLEKPFTAAATYIAKN